ncbi:hypothetical protein ANCCAN_20203 [Ancylostoma caninum]|uniref:Uncharacterized protein n=1 Tax=Ancylostoma caninum TaxID=29170 RepID=A0A368FPG7_ANCCA|nr:hypothetical protein ANCCAN_20203 [Ancylostoma caninum]
MLYHISSDLFRMCHRTSLSSPSLMVRIALSQPIFFKPIRTPTSVERRSTYREGLADNCQVLKG